MLPYFKNVVSFSIQIFASENTNAFYKPKIFFKMWEIEKM